MVFRHKPNRIMIAPDCHSRYLLAPEIEASTQPQPGLWSFPDERGFSNDTQYAIKPGIRADNLDSAERPTHFIRPDGTITPVPPVSEPQNVPVSHPIALQHTVQKHNPSAQREVLTMLSDMPCVAPFSYNQLTLSPDQQVSPTSTTYADKFDALKRLHSRNVPALYKPFAPGSPAPSFTPPVPPVPEADTRFIHNPYIIWMCKDRNDFRTRWLRVTGTYFPSPKLPTSSPPKPPHSSGTTLPSCDPDSGIDEANLPSDHDSDSSPTLPSEPENPTQPIHLAPTANVLTRAQSKRRHVTSTPADPPLPESSRPHPSPPAGANLSSSSAGVETPPSQHPKPPRTDSSPTDPDLSYIPPIPTFAERVAILKVS